MAAKLTRLVHKIAIQLLLVAESCTICTSLSRRPVRKLLDTPSWSCVSKIVSQSKYRAHICLPRISVIQKNLTNKTMVYFFNSTVVLLMRFKSSFCHSILKTFELS
jgi:hypothetical protein